MWSGFLLSVTKLFRVFYCLTSSVDKETVRQVRRFLAVCFSACFVLFAVFVRLRFLSHVKPNKHCRTDRIQKMSPIDLYSSQHHSSWSRPEKLQGNLRTLWFTDVIVQWLLHEFILRPKFFPSSGFKPLSVWTESSWSVMAAVWQEKKSYKYFCKFSLHFLSWFALCCVPAVYNLYACSLDTFLWWKF